MGSLRWRYWLLTAAPIQDHFLRRLFFFFAVRRRGFFFVAFATAALNPGKSRRSFAFAAFPLLARNETRTWSFGFFALPILA